MASGIFARIISGSSLADRHELNKISWTDGLYQFLTIFLFGFLKGFEIVVSKVNDRFVQI
ncbi:MAG: hypothetical protein GZ094_08410 [Mariniphaga sp.]|nr:hypothetical protein [Mariniphaga sp.]